MKNGLKWEVNIRLFHNGVEGWKGGRRRDVLSVALEDASLKVLPIVMLQQQKAFQVFFTNNISYYLESLFCCMIDLRTDFLLESPLPCR
jgi:hypothetical protein